MEHSLRNCHMNVRLAGVKFWLLWVLASTLSFGLSMSMWGWIEGTNGDSSSLFHLWSPNALGCPVIGFIVGLVQWMFVKNQRGIRLIQWVMGTTLGFCLVLGIGSVALILSSLASLRGQPLTFAGEVVEAARCAALGGLCGGAILGAIQGSTWRVRLSWSAINAFAWMLGWAVGFIVLQLMIDWRYQYLARFSASLQLAVELAILGLVSGLVSSTLTGIFVLKVFRRYCQVNPNAA
jgi:hypothetical protein